MKWIKVKDKRPVAGDDILFTDGERIYFGWNESYQPEEDPLFYNPSGQRNCNSWPENITHWFKPKLPGK